MEQEFTLRIDCISDTHNLHEEINLPGGNILIHSGDATLQGKVNELMKFLNWFVQQDYDHLVFVPGNHDWACETDPTWIKEECDSRGINLLMDSGITIEGIKFWGSPVQPEFCNWAFNRKRGEQIRRHWDLIPNDTNVLITHGPPAKILDKTTYGDLTGCEDLFLKIIQTDIKLHVFGHIHEQRGYHYWDSRTFVNASSVTSRYKIDKPGYIRVIKVENDYFVDVPNEDIEPTK